MPRHSHAIHGVTDIQIKFQTIKGETNNYQNGKIILKGEDEDIEIPIYGVYFEKTEEVQPIKVNLI